MRRLLRFMIPAVVLMGFAERAAEAQMAPPQNAQSSFGQGAGTARQEQDVWDGRWTSAPIQPPASGSPVPAIPAPQYGVGPQGVPMPPVPLPPQMGAMAPGQTYAQTYAQPVVQGTTVQSTSVQSYAMAGGAMFSVTILSVPVVTTTTTEYVTETVARSARRTVRRAPHRRACTCRVVCQ